MIYVGRISIVEQLLLIPGMSPSWSCIIITVILKFLLEYS